MNSIGLSDREEGDLGPVYGFQWRHFGARLIHISENFFIGWHEKSQMQVLISYSTCYFYRYTDMHADYTGQGFDQLLDVIHKIKNKPDDRRIILSAWNPSDLKLMALPPCHMFAQVYLEVHIVFSVIFLSVLNFSVTVLCSKWRVILSNVPAFSRHGVRGSF